MKKFLRLSLVVLLALFCGTTYAQTTTTFDFTGDEGYGMPLISDGNTYNEDPCECTNGNVTMTLTGKTRWWKTSSGNELRVYSGGAITISVPDDYVITNIEIKGSRTFTTTVGSYDNGTWTGSAESVNLNYGGSSTGKISSISVTYEDAPDAYVAVPTISGETTFEGSTEVTITGVEGSTIYYTTDGTDPTTGSTTSGKSPLTFTLDKTATVKAIAVLGSNQSEVASKDFTKIEFTDMTIAGLYELAENTDNINLTITNGKVVYIDKRYSNPSVSVREGDKAIMFYSTTLPFKENAIVNGTIKVDFENYNGGIREVKSNDFTDPSTLTITESTEDAVPTPATIAELLDKKYTCDLIKLSNVSIVGEVDTEDEDNNTYFAEDESGQQIQFYDSKKGVNKEILGKYLNDGNKYNVTAVFNSIYSNKAQLLPVAVEVSSGIENVTVEPEFNENAPVYNLAGQRVSKEAKGIVIQNGKKFIRK